MLCEGPAHVKLQATNVAERVSNSVDGEAPATFIDYFRAQNAHLFGDKTLSEYLKRPLCVAASHTLFSGDLTQSAATWYARYDLEQLLDLKLDRSRHWTFPEWSVELVTHVARLFYLPANVSGRPTYDKALVRTLCDRYASDLGQTDPAVWRVRIARFTTGPASPLHDASPVYREHREFDAYLAYWRVAAPGALQDLLQDPGFCSGIDALALRISRNRDLSGIFSSLDEEFAHRLRPLFGRLRHRLYRNLAADVAGGLLRLPHG